MPSHNDYRGSTIQSNSRCRCRLRDRAGAQGRVAATSLPDPGITAGAKRIRALAPTTVANGQPMLNGGNRQTAGAAQAPLTARRRDYEKSLAEVSVGIGAVLICAMTRKR